MNTTEAPENIGTAFKTIIARVAQVKEAAEEMEDVFDLNKAAQALRSIGISITDTSGQIRDMQYIFGDLGEVWDNLDRNTKAYMATILAGSRQQSRFLALMNDWQRTQELIVISQNSAGEATKQFQTHLTGLDASLQRLAASKEKFMMGLIDANTYKGVIDVLRNLLDIFSGLPPIMTIIIGLLTVLAARTLITSTALLMKNAAMKENLTLSTGQLFLLPFQILKEKLLSGAIWKTVQAFIAKAAAMVVATGGIYLIVIAIGSLVAGLAKAINYEKQYIEVLKESINANQDRITMMSQSTDTLESLLKEQKALINTTNKTEQEHNRLATINAELAESYSHLGSYTDKWGNTIIPNATNHIIEQREEITKLLLATLELKKELAISESKKIEKDIIKDIKEEAQKNLKDLQAQKEIMMQSAEFLSADAMTKGSMIDTQREEYWKEYTRKEVEAIGKHRDTIIQAITDAETLKIQTLNKYEGIGRQVAVDIAEQQRKALITELGDGIYEVGLQIYAEMKSVDFVDFANDFDAALIKALSKITIDEKELQQIVDNINDQIQHAFKEGASAADIDYILQQYYKGLEKEGLSIDFAIKNLNIEEIRLFAQMLQEVEAIEEKFGTGNVQRLQAMQNQSAQSYTAMINYLDGYVTQIERTDETYKQFLEDGNIAAAETYRNDLITERITTLEKLYDTIIKNGTTMEKFNFDMNLMNETFLRADNLTLYNQALVQYAHSLGLAGEELRVFYEMHKQFEPNLGIEDALGAIGSYIEGVKELNTTLHELASGKELNIEQILKLLDTYPELIAAMDVVNGKMIIEKGMIEELIMTREEALKAELANIETNLKSQELLLEIEIAVIEARLAGHLEYVNTLADIQTIAAQIHQEAALVGINSTEQMSEAFGSSSDFVSSVIYQMAVSGIDSMIALARGIGNSVRAAIVSFADLAGAAKAAWDALKSGEGAAQAVASFGKYMRKSYEEHLLKISKPTTPSSVGAAPKSFFETQLTTRLQQLKTELDNVRQKIKDIQKLSNIDLSAALKQLAGGSGGKDAKEAKEAIDKIKNAIDEAADAVEEYVSKLDMWYNALRQILILEQELSKLQKERQLIINNEGALNQSIEQEIILIKQLAAQQQQLQGLYQTELEETATLLLIAAGAAVTLSDDMKHLHVNQSAYQALSMGQKEIVDELIESFDNLSKSVHDSEMQLLDYQIQLQQLQLQAADRLIAAIQAGLKKQQKLLINAIDYEIKAIEKAHKAKMDMYQEEHDAILAIIDAKLKSIDDEAKEEDWQEQLQTAMQEELDLRNRINQLALDDSFEAQSKRAELEEELQAKLKQIEKMQKDRQRALRREELQNLSEHYKKQFDQSRKAAEEETRILREKLEASKTQINYYYQEIYNDEQRWAALRQEILEGNFDNINAMVASLLDSFDETGQGIVALARDKFGVELTHLQELFSQGVNKGMMEIGMSWNATRNIIDEIAQSQQQAISITNALAASIATMTAEVLRHTAAIQAAQQAAASGGSGTHSAPGSSSPSGGESGGGVPHGSSKAYNHGETNGYNWRIQSLSGYNALTEPQARAQSWASCPKETITAHSEHDNGWIDGMQRAHRQMSDIISQQYSATSTSGSTSVSTPTPTTGGNWYENLFTKRHDGGIASGNRAQYHGSYSRISGKENNRLSKLVNDLFQTSNDEVIAKLLKGEVVVNPVASIDNLRNNLRSFTENMAENQMPALAATTTKQEIINIDINHMIADNKKHVEDVFKAIQQGRKRMGGE